MGKTKKVTDRAQTEKIVQDHMDEIIETAEKRCTKRLYIRCQRKACQCGFPCENVWGLYVSCRQIPCIADYTGKGEGHNWWCVLYPNMCFQGSVYEVMDESSGEELREVLTQEEYADVFDSGKMQIRWKFLDYFR